MGSPTREPSPIASAPPQSLLEIVGGEQGVWGLTSLALPKGFPDANLRALGVPAGGRSSKARKAQRSKEIKLSLGRGTQISSGTASGLEEWPGVPRREKRWGFTGGPGFPTAKSGGGSRVGDPQIRCVSNTFLQKQKAEDSALLYQLSAFGSTATYDKSLSASETSFLIIERRT